MKREPFKDLFGWSNTEIALNVLALALVYGHGIRIVWDYFISFLLRSIR